MTNIPTEHTSSYAGSPPGNRASDTASDSTTDQAKSRARDVAETGKQQASRVVEEAKSQTSHLLDEARTQARDRADGQVEQLAGVLDRMSSELGSMAETGGSSGYLTALARDGSSAARNWSRRLEQGGLDGALDDVRRFARQRPVAFLASAFGVGLVLGRVTRNADLKTIVSDDEPSHQTSGVTPRPTLPPTQRTEPQLGTPPSPAAIPSDRPTTSELP